MGRRCCFIVRVCQIQTFVRKLRAYVFFKTESVTWFGRDGKPAQMFSSGPQFHLISPGVTRMFGRVSSTPGSAAVSFLVSVVHSGPAAAHAPAPPPAVTVSPVVSHQVTETADFDRPRGG